MKLNKEKTKYISIGGPNSITELKNGEQLSGRNECTYLETINEDGNYT